MKINKKAFLLYMKRLVQYLKREQKLSDAMAEYCEDLWFFQPKDIVSLAVDLLIELTGDNKEDSIIEYWMWELECGDKWEPGFITDIDGKDIKLKSAEDLYKYLIDYNESKGE